MHTMITRSAAKKSSKAGQAPRMDPALVEQMAIVKSILQRNPVDLKQLSNQCLILSKILDSLVANNRKPDHRHDILPLVQQVCKYKDKSDVRPALLVLLLSIKGAFRTDWLSTLEASGNDEIFQTLNSLFDSFTTGHEISAQPSLQPLQCGGSAVRDTQESLIFLSTITNRFYPRLQMNAVFVAVQAKVGYEILMCDFHVPHMNVQDRVYLYVGRKDSVGTATCLITPPQVNFLVNGQQVEKRVVSGYTDGGPQMPSDVTCFVKVGANVLQVIGEFSESYIIAVASSRIFECSAKNTQLEDYVAPTKAVSCEADPNEVDDEVVEGASRLSLRCPISHQRLVTPVKATACKHLQCFDYDSFLEINEKRPAWRCPCCNRFMSWPDLRIDRNMERILKQTDDEIHEVIISQDGSWVPVSTGEYQSNSGRDATPTEEGEIRDAVIDLSDFGDEEVNGVRMNIDEFQLPETKPDVETLQAINENRDNPTQGTNPGVVNVPDISASAPQSSSNFAGPSCTGPSRNETVLNQPASSAHALPATGHNIQAPHFQTRTSPHLNSPAGPINRSAPSSGNMTSTQLQQPQIGVLSNTGVASRGETGRIRQQQDGQHSGGQHCALWRGPVIPQHQLATNPAQQMPRMPWGGPPAHVLAHASALQQNWRPAPRMRGSIANPLVVGQGVLGSAPRGNPFVDPAHAVQYQMRVPPSVNLPPFPRGPRG